MQLFSAKHPLLAAFIHPQAAKESSLTNRSEMSSGAPHNPRPSKIPRRDSGPHLMFSLLLSYSDQAQHDVKFEVEGERFGAHASIVSAASPVLQVMLTSGMREFASRKVVLRGVKKKTWN